jgi:hypothetical protein
MTYTEKSLIYDKIRNVPAIYWRVSNKEGERQYLNEQDEQIEPEESAELLRNTLESLTGTVFVQIATRDARTIADSKDFQTGIWKYNVKCIRMPEFKQPNVSNGVTLDTLRRTKVARWIQFWKHSKTSHKKQLPQLVL